MSPTDQEIKDEEIIAFLEVFRDRSNYDFTNYSLKSLKRRISKILSDSKLSISQLEDTIFSNPQFMEKVVMSITVNTTELFRDPSIWINLRDEILPKFSGRKSMRIWHAGCSTGQEVYSMMILLDQLNMLSKAEIFASDINSDVLDLAKTGKYKYRFNQAYIDNLDTVIFPEKDPSEEKKQHLHENYFIVDKARDLIQMKKFLTEKPVFKKIDLVKDENLFAIKFDLIICRNVIIYFNSDLQNKVFNLFYKNLSSDGCLVLGVHESIIGPYSTQFVKKNQVYFKNPIRK